MILICSFSAVSVLHTAKGAAATIFGLAIFV
jgi:hypothetical protein